MSDETTEPAETVEVSALDAVRGLHEVSCDVPWCEERVGRVVEGTATFTSPEGRRLEATNARLLVCFGHATELREAAE
ncbi:hypothetical protein [Halosegnis marinus]|uniref:Uncharacterized protein n=1 Tax=Halosegnis marinus TaxID=3034023 RepID=A0ABD5ZJX3_9EURY|nr:hypothetical protein [Halosegnis sp. DT85]